MKQDGFRNSLRIKQRYKTCRVDTTLPSTLLLVCECFVQRLPTRMACNSTHDFRMDQATFG
jgi:hypothetical protein